MSYRRKAGYRRYINLVVTFSLAALTMVYLSHALPRWLPGDFVTAMYAGSQVTLTLEEEAELRAYYEGDQTFGDYLSRLLHLDWGYSYAFLSPVASLFLAALPWSLLLVGSAHILSTGLGFVLGVEAAWRRNGKTGRTLVGTLTVLEGIPEISTGVILILIFSLHLGWFPAGGAETAYAEFSGGGAVLDVLRHLTLPLATLMAAYFPGNFLLARNSMIMVTGAPYVTTARAKGLPPLRVRYAHAARNALLPIVTRFGLRVSFMLTGALVVERLNAYPGLGTLLFNAIQARDLPVIQGVVLMSSLLVLAVILGLEVLYRLLDPRIAHAR